MLAWLPKGTGRGNYRRLQGVENGLTTEAVNKAVDNVTEGYAYERQSRAGQRPNAGPYQEAAQARKPGEHGRHRRQAAAQATALGRDLGAPAVRRGRQRQRMGSALPRPRRRSRRRPRRARPVERGAGLANP